MHKVIYNKNQKGCTFSLSDWWCGIFFSLSIKYRREKSKLSVTTAPLDARKSVRKIRRDDLLVYTCEKLYYFCMRLLLLKLIREVKRCGARSCNFFFYTASFPVFFDVNFIKTTRRPDGEFSCK